MSQFKPLKQGWWQKALNKEKEQATSMFKMKYLNKVDTILGIKIKRHSEGFALSLQQNVFSMTNFSEENFFVTKKYHLVMKFIFRHYL